MTVKHLVISGGGPVLLNFLGALHHLENTRFFDIENIESIYATSAGAIVGILLCLKYDHETIYDYIIKRNWHALFDVSIDMFLSAFANRGLFSSSIIEKCFKPLFNAKEIDLNITMQEFYDLTKIELHMFSFEINQFQICDISHLTHPSLKLMTAIHMTCSLPIIMEPVLIDNACYIDGGLSMNYPLNYCIESGKNEDEILGFKNKCGFGEQNDERSYVTASSSLTDYLLNIIFKIILNMSTDNQQKTISNEVICEASLFSIDIMKNALHSASVRESLYNSGVKSAQDFLLANLQSV
jgi:predicted acylesterase/phospholipase RssA